MGRKRKRTRSRGGSDGPVSRRTLLLLLGGGTLGVGGAYASGAFDAVAGDRPLAVGTAGDEDALLGIETHAAQGGPGEEVTLLTLTNQFDTTLETVDVAVRSPANPPIAPGSISTPIQLGPGQIGTVEATLSCAGHSASDVELSVIVGSPDVEVTAVRTVSVSCLGARPVCEPRDPPGCIESELPGPPESSTDCSVVLEGGEFDERISGNTEIGGALVIDAGDEVDLGFRGGATVGEHVRVDAGAEIDFSVEGGATIGDVVQLQTADAITAEVGRNLGGGICAQSGDEVEFEIDGGATVDGDTRIEAGSEIEFDVNQGATVDGDTHMETGDEVTATLDGDATLGSLTVDTDDEADLDLTGGSRIDGATDIDAGDAVTVTLDGDETIDGDLDIEAGSDVTLELHGSSEITGDVRIQSGDEIEIDLTEGSTIGSIDIDGEGEVELNIDGWDAGVTGDVYIHTLAEVEVEIESGGTIGGDLTIEGTSEIEVDGCDAVAGTVTPASAC